MTKQNDSEISDWKVQVQKKEEELLRQSQEAQKHKETAGTLQTEKEDLQVRI